MTKTTASSKQSRPPLSLTAVYIRKASVQICDWFDPTIAGQKLVGKYRISGGKVDTIEMTQVDAQSIVGRYCRFVTSFEFQYSLEKEGQPGVPDDQKLAAEIMADIAINYAVTDGGEPTGDVLEKWGQTNVLLHSWPYWREFCQSSLARLHLPAQVMPLLDIQAAIKEQN